jgi:DNA-binding transcriptional regulator YiaG
MHFTVKISPKDLTGFHSVSIEGLDIYTQGKNRDDCIAMAKDAVEITLDISVDIVDTNKKGHFLLKGSNDNDSKVLTATMLKAARAKSGLSTRDVAARLGHKSANAYAKYEQAKSAPSVNKLGELMDAINPDRKMVIKFEKGA